MEIEGVGLKRLRSKERRRKRRKGRKGKREMKIGVEKNKKKEHINRYGTDAKKQREKNEERKKKIEKKVTYMLFAHIYICIYMLAIAGQTVETMGTLGVTHFIKIKNSRATQLVLIKLES